LQTRNDGNSDTKEKNNDENIEGRENTFSFSLGEKLTREREREREREKERETEVGWWRTVVERSV